MKKTTAVILLFAACGRAFAAGSAGSSPFNFLFLDAGARPVALGGACTALPGGPDSLLYNPAGLGEVRVREAAFMHNMYFQDISQQYAAYADPGGWGVSLNYLDFGKVRRTTYSTHSGAALGNTGMTDLALTGGYSADLSAFFMFGGALKYVRESVAGVAGSAFAADLGLLYFPPAAEELTVGLAVQNIGPSVKFQGDREALPLNVRAGASYKLRVKGQPGLVTGDVAKAPNEDALLALGVETVFAETFPVRLGYSMRNQAGAGVTFGLGYKHGNMAFDYAFVPFGDLGAAHRFSAGLKWGAKDGARVKKEKKEEVPVVRLDPREAERLRKEELAARYEKLLAEAQGKLGKKDFDSAILYYKQAVQLQPENHEPRLALADTLVKAGSLQEADEAYEAAFGLVPQGSDRAPYAAERRGAILSKLEKYSAARKQFQKAIDLSEEKAMTGTVLENAYFGLGYCLEKQDKIEEAIAAYRRAQQIVRNDALRNQIEHRLSYLEVGNR